MHIPLGGGHGGVRPSSTWLFLHRECAGKFLGAVEGVHAEGGAVVEGGCAELGNVLREDVLFVAGGGHPCIEETDGEGGVGVGLDGRAIGLSAEDLFAIGFPGVNLFAGFVADAEGFGDVLCHGSSPDAEEVEAIRQLFLIPVRMAVCDLSQLAHAASLNSCGFPEDGFETEGG